MNITDQTLLSRLVSTTQDSNAHCVGVVGIARGSTCLPLGVGRIALTPGITSQAFVSSKRSTKFLVLFSYPLKEPESADEIFWMK